MPVGLTAAERAALEEEGEEAMLTPAEEGLEEVGETEEVERAAENGCELTDVSIFNPRCEPGAGIVLVADPEEEKEVADGVCERLGVMPVMGDPVGEGVYRKLELPSSPSSRTTTLISPSSPDPSSTSSLCSCCSCEEGVAVSLSEEGLPLSAEEREGGVEDEGAKTDDIDEDDDDDEDEEEEEEEGFPCELEGGVKGVSGASGGAEEEEGVVSEVEE